MIAQMRWDDYAPVPQTKVRSWHSISRLSDADVFLDLPVVMEDYSHIFRRY